MIKQEEDAAPQKIAALRYLATIGCAGCYPGVEEAFIASMEDCTEEVRFEAILAIRHTTTCPCECCGKSSCCSEKIQKKLRELAFDTDDSGRPKESSERVRRQARLALAQCGPPVSEAKPVEEPKPQVQEGPPEEGPGEAPAAEPGEGNGNQNAPTDSDQEANVAASKKLAHSGASASAASSPTNVNIKFAPSRPKSILTGSQFQMSP